MLLATFESNDPIDSGAEGNRTPDLLNAIQALSQLSYGPSTHNTPEAKPAFWAGFGPSILSKNAQRG